MPDQHLHEIQIQSMEHKVGQLEQLVALEKKVAQLQQVAAMKKAAMKKAATRVPRRRVDG